MKNSIYISMLALAISLSSCQKDDIAIGIDPNAVRVTASVGDESVITRTNPNGAEQADRTKFNDRDAISIQAGSQSAIVYTLSGETWAAASNYLLWETSTMTFNAFHPTTEGTSMTAFTLPTDQSNATKIAAADYMTFTGDKSQSGIAPIDIAFTRQMSRVIVKITKFEDQFGAEDVVSDLKINSGAASLAPPTPIAVTPLVAGIGAVETTYTALVVPTTAKADETFITFKVGGTDLTVKGIPVHESGHSYTYNLTVGKDVVNVISVTVSEWGTGFTISEDAEARPVSIGDYFYSDDSYSELLDKGKTVTGIIVSVNKDNNITSGLIIELEQGLGDWVAATSRCPGLVWRLPTIEELKAVYAGYNGLQWVLSGAVSGQVNDWDSGTMPSVSGNAYTKADFKKKLEAVGTDFTASYYWSSAELSSGSSNSWSVAFVNGSVNNFSKFRDNSVRCVRDF